MVKTARNLVGHQIGWWLWWQLWWRIWWFTNFVDKFDDLFWSPNLSPNLSLNSSQYSSPNISPNFANQQIFHQIFHQNHHPISWPTKCGDENDIKIITQFGESPNKVTNMSPNSSPNLVITKFVTKFITKFVTKYLGDLYDLDVVFEGNPHKEDGFQSWAKGLGYYCKHVAPGCETDHLVYAVPQGLGVQCVYASCFATFLFKVHRMLFATNVFFWCQ